MMSRKQPLRTYQRKCVKKHFAYTSTTSTIISDKLLSVKHQHSHDASGSGNDSSSHNLFETTFDRVAKGAVLPPWPSNINHDNSWHSSSVDSDINDVMCFTRTSRRKDSNYAKSDVPSSNLNSLNLRSKYNTQHKHPSETAIHKEILSKKSRTTSTKNKILTQRNIRAQAKKTGKLKREKVTRYRLNKSNHTLNDQISHTYSDALINRKDIVSEDDIALGSNAEQLQCRNVLSVDRSNVVTVQPALVESDADTYTSDHHQAIKPCFVGLNAYAIENWHAMGDVKTIKDISQNKTNTFVGKNILQSNSIEINDVIGTFKRKSIKPCSVKLCNNAVTDWYASRYKNSDSADFNKVSPFLSHNLLETASTRSSTIVRDIFEKVERLKIDKSINEEKARCIVSSTPIGKPLRSGCTYPGLYSLVNDGCAMTASKENISNIVPLEKRYDHNTSSPSLFILEDDELDPIDMQEQSTQVLLSQCEVNVDCVKTEEKSSYEDIHEALTQMCSIQDMDVKMRSPYFLSSSADIDQSRSLFNDTTRSHDSLIVNTVGNNEEREYLTDTHDREFTKLDRAISLSENNDIACTRKAFESESEEGSQKSSAQSVCPNSTKIDIDCTQNITEEFHDETQQIVNAIDVQVLLTQLQDPIRVTERRIQYPKWYLSTLNVSESLSNNASNKQFHCVATDTQSTDASLDHFDDLLNGSVRLRNHDTHKLIETKSVCLKPGKHWARSLSILNNIGDGFNLDKLSIGKGKRWRQSVRDILDMQKQGVFQSCLKRDKDDENSYSSCEGLDASNVRWFGDNRCKDLNSTNSVRFSKRISVRVVPNSTSVKYNVKDASFLEAFGITPVASSPESKLLPREELSIRVIVRDTDNQIKENQLTPTTAKDVVLQRCSQKYYLPFSECFPDTYLKYCRKIGEGVYGEVFLYEHDDKKSVIKIIPIEGEELINGEPQKKFNEILSEIVIAKELDNLKSNTTYKTSGFVEVRSIKCITGRYPKRLVELWNIYDNDKTSDNDCPSIFGENQLYIALELCHGGEDLEAFVFQTAEEARSLFLQTALALAVAEKALEFEHRDLHWGNVLISRTSVPYVYYNLGGREIKISSNGVKVSIIDFTLSRMLYQGCCIYNDLALDPALFTAHGEYQFDIYRLMRDKVQNNWQTFEPHTNVLWLHYTLDKMITSVRYKKQNLRVHKQAIVKLKEWKNAILSYDSAFDFVINHNSVACLQCEPI